MERRLAVCAILLLLFASSLSAQTIYKWKDEKGTWHFGQSPPSNAPAVEQRILPTPKPEDVPRSEPCSPFKVGETRPFKAFKPSPDFPHLQTKDFQMRLVEATKDHSTFSWRLTITNSAIEREGVRGTVTWKDCDGFVLAETALTPTAIGAGGEEIIAGNKTIFGPAASKVARFGASFSGQHPVRIEQQVKQTESYKKLDVRVYYTQLQDVDSAIYFVGEVHNVGLARARRVIVIFTIKDERGTDVVKDKVETSPDELAPGQSGMFRKRVPQLSSPRGYGWHSKAEWSE